MKTVIMCGGAGTRLWPISKKESPKQFLKIFNGMSLFEKTIQRNLKITDEYIIVVNEIQLPICKEQTKAFDKKFNFIIEPIARNTAPAISLAALFADKDDELLVVPSDHLIFDQEIYEESIIQAVNGARDNQLITIGIRPTYPETGFGYIKIDKKLDAPCTKVLSFKEKPNLEKAIEYLESGNFLWNSGMFCFKSSVFLSELEKHSNSIFTTISSAYKSKKGMSNVHTFNKDLILKVKSESVDYAIFEKSDNVSVIPSSFRWSDLGSYDSLYQELDKDENNNTKDKNLTQYNSKNNLVISHKKTIALFNVEDLIVVDSEDAILVGRRGRSQDVKKIPKY